MFAWISCSLLWLVTAKSTFARYFRCSYFNEFDNKGVTWNIKVLFRKRNSFLVLIWMSFKITDQHGMLCHMYKYKWYTVLKNIEDRQSKWLACIVGFFWCDFLFWFVFIRPRARSKQKIMRERERKNSSFLLPSPLPPPLPLVFWFDLGETFVPSISYYPPPSPPPKKNAAKQAKYIIWTHELCHGKVSGL